MDSLIDSMIAQDFSPQRQTKISGYATEYFPELVERLDRMDFGKLSLLLLEYGMNDYQNGTPLENPQDALDEYTFAGALRLVLGKAKIEFPNCRIVLVSPTYSWYVSDEKSCEEMDFGGGFLEDYVNSIMKDLIKLMDPKYIEVTGFFVPRGGISIYPYANYGRPGTKYEALAEQRMCNWGQTPFAQK